MDLNMNDAVDDLSSSSSSSSDEDSDAMYLNDTLDQQINATLAKIKKQDSSIYQSGAKFYDDDDDDDDDDKDRTKSKKRQRPVRITDAVTEQTLNPSGDESSSSSEQDDDHQHDATYVSEQRAIREALLKAVSDDDDDQDESDDFLQRKRDGTTSPDDKHQSGEVKTEEVVDIVLDDQNVSDKDKEFLRNYLTKQWWKEKDTSKLPSYKEIVGEDEPSQPNVSDDEEALKKQDKFEGQYNFRFEERGAGAKSIITYPRNIPDVVRKKDTRRKRKREERKKRKAAEKEKKMEEIKQLKNKKKREIIARLRAIQQITGSDLVGVADFEGEFDSTQHDQLMSAMFEDDGAVDSFDETRKRLADAEKSEALVEFEKHLEELYALDVEDVLGGDIPCRYKYISVPKCDYGMSAEEILFSDDKELNQKLSMKKLAPFRDDVADNTPYWNRISSHPKKNSGKRRKKSTNVKTTNEETTAEPQRKPKRKRRRRKKKNVESTDTA